ncbi:MAG: urease accessory protein UreE, partial [Candidatus Doudnabacteria bacterium]|nr:urease accessory protein UreE [Candidatus Doudnabacteria bacterium]
MLKAITISSDKTLKHCEHTITLDFNQRYRRRCLMTTDDGCEFMLSLPNATVLKQG